MHRHLFTAPQRDEVGQAQTVIHCPTASLALPVC